MREAVAALAGWIARHRRPIHLAGRIVTWLCLPLSLALVYIVMHGDYWPADHALDAAHHQIGRDFINNWAGPQIAFSGHLATLFDLKGYVKAISRLFGQPLPFHNWGYPPFTLILFWPLGQLPYFWALGVWTVLFFGLYAWVGLSFVPKARRWAMLLVLLLAPATLVNAIGGQNGFVTAALMIGGILILKNRPILSGVLFGFLTSKPQLGLGLPLVLILWRAWKTIAAAMLTLAALVSVSIAVFGTEPWRKYLTVTSAYQVLLLKNFHGFYTYMMTSVLTEARALHAPFPLAALIQGVVSLPVLAAATWAATRTDDARKRAFVLAAAAPLITPYAFNYDLTAVSLCLSWRMIDPVPGETWWEWIAIRIAWLAPIGLMGLNIVHVPIGPPALLAAFAAAARDAVRREGVAQSSLIESEQIVSAAAAA